MTSSASSFLLGALLQPPAGWIQASGRGGPVDSVALVPYVSVAAVMAIVG